MYNQCQKRPIAPRHIAMLSKWSLGSVQKFPQIICAIVMKELINMISCGDRLGVDFQGHFSLIMFLL